MAINSRLVRDLLILTGFALLVVFIFFLAGAIRGIETLEQRLSYQQPALTQSEPSYSEGIQYTYVPAYSHIYAAGGKAYLLETTLSIRNTDPEYPLTVHSVKYFDTQGNLIRDYVKTPVTVAPMASADYLAEKADTEGGSGANFVVLWSSERHLAEPVIETIMIGASAEKSISFSSRGEHLLFPFNTEQE